jgi:hypothetical protein
MNQAIIEKDLPNKKLKVTRHINAPCWRKRAMLNR